MDDPTTFLSTLMGIIATLFALYIATSVLVFQTISSYKKEINDKFYEEIELGEAIITNTKEKKEKCQKLFKDNSEKIGQLEKEKESVQETIKQINKKINELKEKIKQLVKEKADLQEIINQKKEINEQLREQNTELKKLSKILYKLKELLEKVDEVKKIKTFNIYYNKKIQSITNIFLILAILVVIFEIYNGVLIYIVAYSIFGSYEINLLFSFAYFIILVALIIGISCDIFYYMVYSQNPKLFDNSSRNRIRFLEIDKTTFFNIIAIISLCFIIFTFFCYLSPFLCSISENITITSYLFVFLFILSFFIACLLVHRFQNKSLI